jgi:hypothetical protein
MLYRSAPGPTLARLRRPTAARPTRLAVVADPHVTPWATGTWTVRHRAEERFARAIADSDRADVDAVVCLGDLTSDGRRVAFDRVDELLAALDVPVLAVPGERDVPKTSDGHRTPPVAAFAERYAAGSFPFVNRVGGVDLVGIDTATMPDDSLADAHGGAVSAAQLDWPPACPRPTTTGWRTRTNSRACSRRAASISSAPATPTGRRRPRSPASGR